MIVNLDPETFYLTSGAVKHYTCSKCKHDKAFVVRNGQELVCIECRYKEIGKDALYEGVYNGMD